MSELNLPKRRLVYEKNQELFEEKINALADTGYTMEHYGVDPGDGEVSTFFSAIMKLKTEPTEDFNNVDDAMVLPLENYTPGMVLGSPLISKATAEGWRIIAIYKGTKDTPSTAIVVRKKKEEK